MFCMRIEGRASEIRYYNFFIGGMGLGHNTAVDLESKPVLMFIYFTHRFVPKRAKRD